MSSAPPPTMRPITPEEVADTLQRRDRRRASLAADRAGSAAMTPTHHCPRCGCHRPTRWVLGYLYCTWCDALVAWGVVRL